MLCREICWYILDWSALTIECGSADFVCLLFGGYSMYQMCCTCIPYANPGTDHLFLNVIQGETGKMSGSDPNSAIYATDSSKMGWWKPINKYAFSGGQDFVQKHRQLGANLEVDISVKYLNFFLEDDAELEHIKTEYAAGRMLSGEVKNRLGTILAELVERHRAARAIVNDKVVDAFMAVRPLPNLFD
ncbi:hypothetical protein DKX38_006577 [Salix brachista]|uniref:tryptophan--tRNA ligase n=1 Tax=Salix brachista TaxID=2182728 RepID=A0A5N5N265_9ROSI|nr:hypothetical protein DKX38_006577 [Salix brachista]